MTKFIVYGKPTCIWCDRAKKHLASAGHQYDYIDLTQCPGSRAKLMQKGFRTVPQIYFGDRYVGGFESLIDFLEGGSAV